MTPIETKVLKMGRTFIYCRVSTTDQTTENQTTAIKNAGYEFDDNRVISETISGKVPALQRKEFSSLMIKIESGDTLIVLKLDRLGRDIIDVNTTVEHILQLGIKLIVIDLPVQDLSSSQGRLMVGLFSSFAQFERDRISERTIEGLERAKEQGKTLGRPVATGTTKQVLECKQEGLSQAKVAKKLVLSLSTVKRHWNK